MSDELDNDACVDAWLNGPAKGLAQASLVQAFEEAFGALWWRAHVTLGDVTLAAIADRVLHDASGRFPALSFPAVASTGPSWDGLREHADRASRDDLAVALRFVLTEFLRVLGSLTGDILTPALHAELCGPTQAVGRAKAKKAKRKAKRGAR